uniref:Uncharacterized protein n=1 Tax=Amphimedon queenslandica TaxID=400682 RepID=A0A1X7T5U8_AMPQE
MSSRWPERKQLSTFSTSHYDDEMSAELTKESAYSPHSSTANIKCVKALLSLPLVNSKDQYGRSALMIAAHKGNIPIFQLLIKKGANLYDKDNGSRTVMHWAATSGNLSFLEMLYKRYIPDISQWSCTDEDGATPLHYSLIGSNTQILQFLISKVWFTLC